MQFADDLGKLILRVALGVLILFHGVAKLLHGVDGIVQSVAALGVPGAFGYAVYLGEVVAPLLLIIGLWARLGGLLVAINMTVAVLLVHTSQFFSLGPDTGWALQLQGMYFCAALGVLFLGAGRFSVGGARGFWN